MYQHGSLVVTACHPCRLLTLSGAFLPMSASLSECMKHDRACIVILPLHSYNVLYMALTISVATACRGVKLEQHCLQNTQTEYPHTHIYKSTCICETCIHAFMITGASNKRACLCILELVRCLLRLSIFNNPSQAHIVSASQEAPATCGGCSLVR